MHRTIAITAPLALGASLAALALIPAPTGTAELTEQNYDKLMKHILPSEKENAWQEIPWRNTFWDAVQEANRLEKPLLLWGMNGHPLGCT